MRQGTDELDEADRQFRLFMWHNLRHAAEHFGVRITGEAVFGWLDRSIGASVDDSWLRVVSEPVESACGAAWTGNEDANTVAGLAKPRVLAVHEWTESDWRRQRAELTCKLPGTPCSSDATPPADLSVSDGWWRQLRENLDRLHAAETTRTHTDQERTSRRVREQLGQELTITSWQTVHGDLHWGNLLQCPFGLLDWELWGRGPTGTDEATLYLYSLATPAVARAVHAQFAETLDSPDGRRAQLCVAARLLHRSTFGDHPDLVAPLRQLVSEVRPR